MEGFSRVFCIFSLILTWNPVHLVRNPHILCKNTARKIVCWYYNVSNMPVTDHFRVCWKSSFYEGILYSTSIWFNMEDNMNPWTGHWEWLNQSAKMLIWPKSCLQKLGGVLWLGGGGPTTTPPSHAQLELFGKCEARTSHALQHKILYFHIFQTSIFDFQNHKI